METPRHGISMESRETSDLNENRAAFFERNGDCGKRCYAEEIQGRSGKHGSGILLSRIFSLITLPELLLGER